MTPPRRLHILSWAPALLSCALLAACQDQDAISKGDDGVAARGVDTTTLDRRDEQPPDAAEARRVRLTLPNGTTVVGTPAAAELLDYLSSEAAAGRRFDLDAIGFVHRENVRQDPDGAITTLAAIMQAFPEARYQVEVREFNPQEPDPHDRAIERAAAVERALVAYGVPDAWITSEGVDASEPIAPEVELVVVAK